MSIKDKTAIVGVGATPYYRRGQSLPQTTTEMASKATCSALDDAGLDKSELDGFAIYSFACDPWCQADRASVRSASPRP